MTSNHHAPYGQGYTRATSVASNSVGHSGETARENLEEGGDDVKSSCPLWPGLHTCYNGVNKGKRACECEQISKITSQFGL